MVGDLLTYLPGDLLVKVDLASMAHGLECRGPFLDHRVVELAAAMPLDRKLRFRPGRSKVVLKRAFADLLPKSIRTRRKMGFGVPVGRWFQHELKDELRDILLDRLSLDRGLFRHDAVRTLVADHLEGRREHGHRLWALVMLELWFRNHLDAPARVDRKKRFAENRTVAFPELSRRHAHGHRRGPAHRRGIRPPTGSWPSGGTCSGKDDPDATAPTKTRSTLRE